MTSAAVHTVRGPVDPADLGFTLPAEHFYIQHSSPDAWQMNDEEVFAAELDAFAGQGGTCVADLTGASMGRDPQGLRALSERTGVHIVMATGWYTDETLPAEDLLDRRSTAAIAESLVEEIRTGESAAGIRPGVIGEFGPVRRWLTPMDERLHRAYARAHRDTGIPLSTHAWRSEVGLDQLDLFDEEQVDPAKVAIGHCDSWPFLPYWERVAERGAYVQLDNISLATPPLTERLVQLVRAMVDNGWVERILMSHDLAMVDELSQFGGAGLTYLHARFVPLLLEAGVDQEAVNVMVSDNPRRFLTMPAES
jgi:phosphotriesterase-related protein